MAADCCGVCCMGLLLIFVGFLVFASPWLSVGGPWVTYTVNTTSTSTYSDLILQFPMLQFDRQQYLSSMCVNRITLDLWLTVFQEDPLLSCTRHGLSWGSSYRDCYLTYCLHDWAVWTNNRTHYSHNVHLFANPSFYLSVTDACWFVWWLPAVIFMFCEYSAVAVIYTIAVFSLRVCLSVASVIVFYDYNGRSDPPFTGYLKSNPNLQKATYWTYDWGLAFGWITAISNVIGFLVVLIGGIVYFCSSAHRDKVENQFGGWRTSSREFTSRLRKGDKDTDERSSESVGHDTDAVSEQPYKQLNYGTSGMS